MRYDVDILGKLTPNHRAFGLLCELIGCSLKVTRPVIFSTV